MITSSGFNYFEQKIEIARSDNLDDDLARLFDYWSGIKSNAIGPSWSEFDWDGVPTGLLKWAGVVDVSEDPVDFVYRYWGSARTYFETRDMMGRSINDLRPRMKAEKAFRDYNLVRIKKCPLLFKHKDVKNYIADSFDYQLLRLPFSNDGENVHAIFAVAVMPSELLKSAYDFYEKERLKREADES